jgi:hypothetical protein
MAVVAALATSACDRARKPPRERAQPAHTRIKSIIALPGGQGTAHVLVVPTGFMESARCVIVTSPIGSPAVACTPKDLDIEPGSSD